jgi:CBS domain containing-hemolysin-like protein
MPVTLMLAQVISYLATGLPVTVTWYSIQSPFFTPIVTSAKATANNAVTTSTVKTIAIRADFLILSMYSQLNAICLFKKLARWLLRLEGMESYREKAVLPHLLEPHSWLFWS